MRAWLPDATLEAIGFWTTRFGRYRFVLEGWFGLPPRCREGPDGFLMLALRLQGVTLQRR